MSRTCTQCQVDKAVSHFAAHGRGLSTVCKACQGKEDGEKALAARAVPAPVTIVASLQVPSGLGFRASLEDGTFCIEQDRPDGDGNTYTHSLALAPHEARQFVEWIEERVKGRQEAA